MNTSKQERLQYCKFYHNEENNPFVNTYTFDDYPLFWFWEMERVYVNNFDCFQHFDENIQYYKNIGGKIFDKIPTGLCITMFLSWGKYQYNPKLNIDKFNSLIQRYIDYKVAM